MGHTPLKTDPKDRPLFPRLPEFQQVAVKVIRWEERDKRFVIREGETVG